MNGIPDEMRDMLDEDDRELWDMMNDTPRPRDGGPSRHDAINLLRKLAEARLEAQMMREGLEPLISHRECVGMGCIMCGDRGSVSWMHALIDAENQTRRLEAKCDELKAKLDNAGKMIRVRNMAIREAIGAFSDIDTSEMFLAQNIEE